MKTNDILNLDVLDIMKMDMKELKKLTSQLGGVVNKRASRLEEHNIDTPALKGLKKSGGKISTKGLTDINDVRAEFFRAKKYAESKTGTVSGAKKVANDARARAFEITGGTLTKTQENRMWRVYNRMREMHPDLLYTNGKYNASKGKALQTKIAKEIETHKSYGVDRMTSLLNEQLEQEYNERENAYNDSEFYINF